MKIIKRVVALALLLSLVVSSRPASAQVIRLPGSLDACWLLWEGVVRGFYTADVLCFDIEENELWWFHIGPYR